MGNKVRTNEGNPFWAQRDVQAVAIFIVTKYLNYLELIVNYYCSFFWQNGTMSWCRHGRRNLRIKEREMLRIRGRRQNAGKEPRATASSVSHLSIIHLSLCSEPLEGKSLACTQRRLPVHICPLPSNWPETLFPNNYSWYEGLSGDTLVNNLPANEGDARDASLIPGWRRAPRKEMATHSSILAWEIPWIDEIGGLQSMGLQRVRHDWNDLACIYTHIWAFQVVLVVKNSPANAGDRRDQGLIPGSGRSPGGGHSNPLQYSCLEKPVDRGAWQAAVH